MAAVGLIAVFFLQLFSRPESKVRFSTSLRWQDTPQTRPYTHQELALPADLDWRTGAGILTRNGPDRVLFWARLPLILVACLLVLVIFLWARQLFVSLEALGALFLFVLDPTIVGHSFTVTTDVGVAAFGTLFILGAMGLRP